MPNKLIRIFFTLLSCLVRLDVNSLSGIEIKIIFLIMKLKLYNANQISEHFLFSLHFDENIYLKEK